VGIRQGPPLTLPSGTQRARANAGNGPFTVRSGPVLRRCGPDLLPGVPAWPGRPASRDGPAHRAGPTLAAGQQGLIIGVRVPRGLPDTPDGVLKLTSRDRHPDPSLWGGPHLAAVPDQTHPMNEFPEPGCSPGRPFHGPAALLQPTVISTSTSPWPGSSMARIPVTIQASSPRASGESAMPFILPGAGQLGARLPRVSSVVILIDANARRPW
jgi:hypothetical protein